MLQGPDVFPGCVCIPNLCHETVGCDVEDVARSWMGGQHLGTNSLRVLKPDFAS